MLPELVMFLFPFVLPQIRMQTPPSVHVPGNKYLLRLAADARRSPSPYPADTNHRHRLHLSHHIAGQIS